MKGNIPTEDACLTFSKYLKNHKMCKKIEVGTFASSGGRGTTASLAPCLDLDDVGVALNSSSESSDSPLGSSEGS